MVFQFLKDQGCIGKTVFLFEKDTRERERKNQKQNTQNFKKCLVFVVIRPVVDALVDHKNHVVVARSVLHTNHVAALVSVEILHVSKMNYRIF